MGKNKFPVQQRNTKQLLVSCLKLTQQKYNYCVLNFAGQSLTEAGYDHWAGGEPNNAKGEENHYEGEYCGSIDAGCEEVGLNDLWCEHENPFICEKEFAAVESLAPATTTVSYTDMNTVNPEQEN